MILVFISGLSSKVKIKVKSDVNPQRLQLRGERGGKKRESRGGLFCITRLYSPSSIPEK